jgi:zonular occludens toxin Zot
MAVYFITGKLGSGKTLVTVGKILEYMMRGRPIATNLDLYPEKFASRNSKVTYTRLPDKPRVSDLELIGEGNPTPNEENNGLLVLDECGTWLNSRTWNDPERKGFVDWMLHARKLGWDVLFIIQNIEIVDKQIKLGLCEHLVVCKRLDRLQIPFLSRISKMFRDKPLNFPKIHRARVFYGDSLSDMLADVWTYQGRHLYTAYDTRQAFTLDEQIIDDNPVDMRATYSVLSRWHTEGRYTIEPEPIFPFPKDLLQLLCYPMWILIIAARFLTATPARRDGVSV